MTAAQAPLPFTPARRGMVCVHVKHQRDWFIGEPNREHDDVVVGIVTGITREGLVRRFKVPSYEDSWNERDLRRCGGQVLVCPDVDPAGAEQAARAHHWPKHPESPRPFASVAEVREALRPHRKPA